MSHKHEAFGGNVEQAFRFLKRRIKGFNSFKGSLNRALSWLRSFAYVRDLITTISQGVITV